MIFDCFPFFEELDILELRLRELGEVVDRFLIVEARETYGGEPHLSPLPDAFSATRFDFIGPRAIVKCLDKLKPTCTDRKSGREREAFQRNALLGFLLEQGATDEDVVIFSDCDEIPRAAAVREALPLLRDGIVRLKQKSFYYHVGWQVDYGHDWASRARMGTVAQIKAIGSMYGFRMAPPAHEVENGGWHFGYFGGQERIQRKVAAMQPFLEEYKLFGDEALTRDIAEGRDLHHRNCELPRQFSRGDNDLPAYLLANRERFAHFWPC